MWKGDVSIDHKKFDSRSRFRGCDRYIGTELPSESKESMQILPVFVKVSGFWVFLIMRQCFSYEFRNHLAIGKFRGIQSRESTLNLGNVHPIMEIDLF